MLNQIGKLIYNSQSKIRSSFLLLVLIIGVKIAKIETSFLKIRCNCLNKNFFITIVAFYFI